MFDLKKKAIADHGNADADGLDSNVECSDAGGRGQKECEKEVEDEKEGKLCHHRRRLLHPRERLRLHTDLIVSL